MPGILCHGQEMHVTDTTTASTKNTMGSKSSDLEKITPWQPIPKKAGLYAALLPGLGQAYNRQYWKIPIVYVGLGVAGYFVVRNTTEYNKLRKAYIGRISSNYPTDEYIKVYSTEQLRQLQDDQSRTVNMTILFSSLGYLVQVLDAITSAHLRNFDISRDISLRMQPVVSPYGAGMGLVMNF
jgi:hypothetical protein